MKPEQTTASRQQSLLFPFLALFFIGLLLMNTDKKTYAVIRAVYDNHHAPEDFERELDFVLSRKVSLVIIEPESLGEVTWRWIRTGNWLHKTAVICGFSALATAGFAAFWNSHHSYILSSSSNLHSRWLNDTPAGTALLVLTPRLLRMSTTFFSGLSSMAASFYALFWQWDPCCKYQVAPSLSSLPRGLRSIMNGSHKNPYRSSNGSPACLGSIGNSPNGSSGLSQMTGNNGRIRPVITENPSHPYGPPLRPVVLIHRDDGRRKLLHNTLALSSTVVAVYVLYQWSQPGAT
ncbi:transmembrane protein 11 mitochondrial [Clonorchis sinensis]|uniref:Transmembrane protein 11 mitochondrial n=1 Tax=Clonorchis sinensis TaxID=79923 RepID=H2KNQ3_CLOSI|nr:transmembrane protein 11 mitochondrial [Clonorchis sinensis]